MPTYHSPHHYLRATSSSGVSLNGVPWEDVDLTDGSWTLTDPDNLVQSVTHSNGFNNVTWNAANPTADTAVGKFYNWANSSDNKAPRWHKNLLIDGVQPTVRDYILFNSFMENDDAVNDFNQSVILCTAIDPTSNPVTSMDLSGGMHIKNTNSNTAYGTLQYTGLTSSSTGGPDSGVISSFHGGGSRGAGVYHTHKPGVSPFETRIAGSRNSNRHNLTSTLTLKVVVGVGIRSNGDVVALNDQQSFKLRYNAVKLTL